jgi:hypothetical protein
MSIALKHKRKVQAKREKEQQKESRSQSAVNLVKLLSGGQHHAQVAGSLPAEFQGLEQQFSGDLETLKILKGDQQRDPLKKQFIEKYRPLCEWYMQNFQDWGHLQSLAWWLVWRGDSEAFIDIEPALYLGIAHGLSTPTLFKGDWQSWYCDQVKNYYSEKLKAEEQPELGIINKVIADIVNGDIVLNQPLKAKLFALYGKVALLTDDHETAVKAFDKALGFDDAVGVKKLRTKSLEALEKQQKEKQGESDAN